MFAPWLGSNYSATRLLLLGESCYSWDENGVRRSPSPRHSIEIVERAIEDFEHSSGFMKTLSRAITNKEKPSRERLDHCWNQLAFTNFVPRSLDGPRERPSVELWKQAREEFPQILDRLKPTRVIVLGKQMWANMPETSVTFNDDVQGYSLPMGETCYCWAVYHPARGLSWQTLAGFVYFVCGQALSEVARS
jgi:hypothetical protein